MKVAGNVFRANAEDDSLADVSAQGRSEGVVQSDGDGIRLGCAVGGSFLEDERVPFSQQRAVEEVHGRGADEPGDEEIGRLPVKGHGVGDLLDDALLHHGDAVAERQGLDLIVGDVNHRRGEAGVEPGDFGAHLEAGLGVEVGEGLIEQKQLGLADDGAAERDPLALAAGEGGGFAVETGGEIEDLRGVLDPLVNFRPGKMPELQPEGHVLIDRHVRVERVVLEDHGDVAVLGRKVVHDLAVDGDGARGGFLQAGDQAQGRRLAAARGPDQHQQFLVFNDEAGVIHGANTLASRALEDLGQMLEDNLCHAEIVEGQARESRGESNSNRVDGARRLLRIMHANL